MSIRNPKSTASIAGHPIHPMLIPFPIALFVAAFVYDLVFWGTRNESWGDAALWLLGAGLITAAFAAVAGLTDFLGEWQIREMSTAWWHTGGIVVVVLVELGNWYLHYAQGTGGILPTGVILSAVAVGLLVFTGWLARLDAPAGATRPRRAVSAACAAARAGGNYAPDLIG